MSFHVKLNYSSHTKLKKRKKSSEIGKKETEKNTHKTNARGKRQQNVVK